MDSVTKRKLEKETILELIRAAFGNDSQVEKITELTDGYFNNSYCIQLSHGKKIVLKVAPKNDVKVLRYEKELMKTEVLVLSEASKVNVPVPGVLFKDDRNKIIDSHYFFMEYVEGVPLSSIRDGMTKEVYDSISDDLGMFARRISEIEGKYFGFINIKNRRFGKWYDCFRMMITDLMEDAESEKIGLPISKDEALSMIEKNELHLNKVESPFLIHKDLWDGNIFVNPNNHKITGIIDCERAIFGDPLLEPVCGFLDENIVFMNQYYGKITLDNSEQIRIKLYKFYLFLLMVIECPYRQYNDPNFEQWARDNLIRIIHELENHKSMI